MLRVFDVEKDDYRKLPSTVAGDSATCNFSTSGPDTLLTLAPWAGSLPTSIEIKITLRLGR